MTQLEQDGNISETSIQIENISDSAPITGRCSWNSYSTTMDTGLQQLKLFASIKTEKLGRQGKGLKALF